MNTSLLPSYAGAAALFVMLLTGCGPNAGGSAGGERPTRAEINRIESNLVMPEGAEPLGAYARFYAATTANGRRTIIAEFVLRDPEWLQRRIILEKVSPSVFIVDENNMPGVLDAGCGVVTASYDPKSDEMTHPTCNGEA